MPRNANGAADVGEDNDAASSKIRVKKSQLVKAVRAMMQFNAKRTANENPLFAESAEMVVLLFHLSLVPDKRVDKPVMIPLPHPLYNDKSEVCFFAKDPHKEWKELLLNKHHVPGVTKVIGVDKLRRNFKTPEQKRALADSFDLFLCDSRVVEMMRKILGTIFYNKKKKPPIPVRMYKEDPKPNLQKAINGTPLRVPSGPSVGIRIGRCSMSEEQLVENAAAVIARTVKHFSKNPVKAISVQSTDGPALPIWRRPQVGDLLDLKKYHSDAASSSASDANATGGSETEDTAGSDITSDAGETLSTLDTGGESLSELDIGGETLSELDSEAGDVDEDSAPASKQELPLMKGLKQKKKKRAGDTSLAAPKDDISAGPAKSTDASLMPPPPKKKAKKAKAA